MIKSIKDVYDYLIINNFDFIYLKYINHSEVILISTTNINILCEVVYDKSSISVRYVEMMGFIGSTSTIQVAEYYNGNKAIPDPNDGVEYMKESLLDRLKGVELNER